MQESEMIKLAELIKGDKPKGKNNTIMAIAIGLTIALGGNFIGWFATKSTSDVENVTNINKTLEFMQTQQHAADESLADDLEDLKEAFKESIEKIEKQLEKQFTRDDFNREMLYRDQDLKRLQNQIESILDKINENH